MFDEPIALATRRHFEAYAAAFNYDLARFVADLQSRQGRDGRTAVDRTFVDKAPLDQRLALVLDNECIAPSRLGNHRLFSHAPLRLRQNPNQYK
jgi:hypothetical protein